MSSCTGPDGASNSARSTAVASATPPTRMGVSMPSNSIFPSRVVAFSVTRATSNRAVPTGVAAGLPRHHDPSFGGGRPRDAGPHVDPNGAAPKEAGRRIGPPPAVSCIARRASADGIDT